MTYPKETAQVVLDRLMLGESLRSITRSEGMPSMATVMRWLNENEAFRKQYARAKETGLEAMAEEILDIADDGSNDWIEKHSQDGSVYYAENGEAVSRSRLRVDSRKWILSKLLPKKYGDKLELAGDPDAPLTVRTIERVIVKPE